ncbi:MAG: Hpt domain-containing protein [Vulcanimicrobiaceae bacterium]
MDGSAPVLAPRLLEEAFEDDRAAIAEVLAEGAAHAQRVLADIRAAATAGDLHALQRALHALKGTAAGIGAERLRALAESVESRVRAGELPEPEALAALAAAGSDLEAAVARFELTEP